MQTSPEKRSAPPMWVIGAVVALVLGGGAFLYYQLSPLDAPIPPDAGALYADLPQGVTEAGFSRLGAPDAPILIEEFSSYACPHCRDFHETIFPDIVDEIAAGDVQFVLIPVPKIGAGAGDAARAFFCAREQGRAWEMHDTLFAWQEQFLTRTFDRKRLEKGAQALGLDVAAFEACMDAPQTTALVDAAWAEFEQRGLTGTPTFFLNGEKMRDYREFEGLSALADQLRAEP